MSSLLSSAGNLFLSAARSSLSGDEKPGGSLKIGGSQLKLGGFRDSISEPAKGRTSIFKVAREPCRLIREFKDNETRKVEENSCGEDPFEELRHRFLSFKRHICLDDAIHYQDLAQGQAPQFMVIACADSRVCPSKILGFQPGEAFTVRNIANLVPPFQHGASETSAALEFAVNSLEVPNILVVGHSRCGGIRALMSMKRENNSRSLISDWVSIAKSARLSTEAAAGNLSFEKQCSHCEKESLNGSLLNLLTYPWIEKRVSEGTLSLHGGYYDFVECTFEKWTLVYRDGLEGGSKYAIKNRFLWA
ncbi:beta carbonic anhydrase 5, chloroplastic-like isoform X1 [Iris pallida]|uniref:Carbonic anhydrase n=1 Tax=Iris pallida TaxID=29817 RepID=A0AAX6EEM6_IRIPA|nr:beta carbonic anhydrase 5, chloroplastic-like isoform X1 [Iris pallida]